MSLGRASGEAVEVLAGVDATDQLVLNPFYSPINGDTVLLTAKPATDPA